MIAVTCTGCALFPPYQVPVDPHTASEALGHALNKLGYPYVWGGRGPQAFDCSGLITWSYKEAVGRERIFRSGNLVTSDATMETLWTWNVLFLTPEQVVPGDIVFITQGSEKVTHGGLVISIDGSNVRFVNASSVAGEVTEACWELGEVVRGQRIIGFGRLKVVIEWECKEVALAAGVRYILDDTAIGVTCHYSEAFGKSQLAFSLGKSF